MLESGFRGPVGLPGLYAEHEKGGQEARWGSGVDRNVVG